MSKDFFVTTTYCDGSDVTTSFLGVRDNFGYFPEQAIKEYVDNAVRLVTKEQVGEHHVVHVRLSQSGVYGLQKSMVDTGEPVKCDCEEAVNVGV